MNKTAMIEWAHFTWNPITGCRHRCPYCYARKFAGRKLGLYALTGFEPTVHLDRLTEPEQHKKPARIFCGSMGDLLGDWQWSTRFPPGDAFTFQPRFVVCEVAAAMEAAPQHSYIVLTKADLNDNDIAHNAELLTAAGAWLGVSVTGIMDAFEINRLIGLAEVNGRRKVVSLEPLLVDLDRDLAEMLYIGIRNAEASWVIIGGLSGAPVFYSDEGMVNLDWLIEKLSHVGVAVFVKDSLIDLVGHGARMRYYPVGMVGGAPEFVRTGTEME